MAGLWSAEVIHAVRLRRATFGTLWQDTEDRLPGWLAGNPPVGGVSSSLVLIDLFAKRRSGSIAGLQRVLAGARPRVRGYREAAGRLRAERPV